MATKLTLEDVTKYINSYDNGKQKMQEEKNKRTNAAPINQTIKRIPTLEETSRKSREAEEQRSALKVQAENKARQEATPNYDRIEEDRMRREASKRRIDNEMKQIEAMGMDASQTDLNRYNQLYNTAENRGFLGNNLSVNDVEVDRYLDPTYRMSKSEEQNAKTLVDNYFRKNPDAKKLLQMSTSNPYRASKLRAQMSDKKREEYDRITSLMNKTSNLSAYTYGLMNIVPFEETIMDKLGGDNDYNYSMQKQNLKTQSPLAFTGGDMTSKLAAYSVLGNALEGIPALGQATNELGQAMAFGNKAIGNSIGNILRGNIADIVLDTIPSEVENYRNGMSAKDIAIDALKNEAANTAFNAVGEIPALVKAFRGLKANKAENAYNANYVKQIEDLVANNTDDVVTAPKIADDVDIDNIEWGRGSDIPTVGEPQSLIKETPVEQIAKETPAEEIVKAEAPVDMENPIHTMDANRFMNDKKYRDSIIKKQMKWYENKGFDVGKDQVRMELESNAMKQLKEAPAEVADIAKNAPVAETPKGRFFDKINTKGLQKDIKFDNDADNEAYQTARKAFLNAYQKHASNPTIDSIDDMVLKYQAMLDASKKGYMEDNSVRDTYRQIKRDFTNRTKGMVIKLSDADLADLPDETITSLNKKLATLGNNTGIKFRKNSGTPIDTLWDDIVTASGNELNPDTLTTQDMVRSLVDYVDNLQTKVNNPTVDRVPADLSLFGVDENLFDDAEDMIRKAMPNKVVAEDIGLNPNTVLEDEIDDVAREADEIVDGNNALKPQEEYNIIESEEPDPGIARGSVVDTTNMKERGFAKHIQGEDTKMKVKDVPEPVVEDFRTNKDLYAQLKNSTTVERAESIYNNPDIDTEAEFRKMLADKDPASIPLGCKIARDYSAKGDHKTASLIYRDLGEKLTEAGQFSQAAAIEMMKNDPLTALAYFERELDKFNKDGAAKYGKKWKDFVLTDAERGLFDNIEPGDKDAIKAAIDKIGVRIEKEYPSTIMDKVLEFRRVAMLFNLGTLERNFLANPATAGLRYVADRIDGIGQWVAHLINPDFEITQAIRGSNKETRALATEMFKSDKVQNLLKNIPGRLSEVPRVGDYAANKQIFKGGFVSDWINRLTNNGIVKLNQKLGKEDAKSVLELSRNAVYKALEVTDSPFVRENFVSRLGSYCRAKGITDIKDIPDEAVNIALEEALKATYKDNSWLVKGIRKIKGATEDIGNAIAPRLGDIASQATIPYVQAPGNIGARILDYSPTGAIKSIGKLIAGHNDPKLVRQGIEELSKGLSGTAMAGLGMALYKAGIITGAESSDPDQRAFEKQNGFREFAIRYKNPVTGKINYDTFNWMQPFSDVIMSGVLLQQAIDEADKYDNDILRYFGYEGTNAGKLLGVGAETAKKEINYFFDATPLKNFGDLFKSQGYSGETDIAGNLWSNTIEDFASAMLPAQMKSIAKTVDTTQRQTTDPSNNFATFVNKLKAGVPELSKTLPVKYDNWGQPMTYGGSTAEAGWNKIFYPGEHSVDSSDKVDKELTRIFEGDPENGIAGVQDSGIFPLNAPNQVDGVKLTAEQKSEYQHNMGVRSREMVEEFMDSDIYDTLEDNERNDIIKSIYGASKAMTEEELFDKEISDKSTYKKLIDAYNNEDLESFFADKGVDEQAKQALGDFNLATNSKAFENLKEKVESGNTEEAEALGNAYQQLDNLGVDTTGLYLWDQASSIESSLTPEKFAEEYKDINSDGKAVSMDNICAYMDRHHIKNQSDADRLWRLYGKSDWKQLPYLDGTWKHKK